MNIKSIIFSAAFSLFWAGLGTAQNLILNANSSLANPTQAAIPNNPLGTCAATCVPLNIPNPTLTSNPKGGGNDQTMNGNGTIANSYFASACGLNYVLGEVKTGKRYSPAAANQPVAISIAGIPVCKTILKAFLYVGGSGNGIAFNTTMTNPAASSSVFPMTPIGNHVDKCWGYTGTYNYRADVTALITGNGNYNISGIPTSITTPGNDMDGASLVIIYTDPTQAYTGHILIGDGCQVGIGGTQTNNITGWSACANSTFSEAFMIVSDLQKVGVANCFMNSAVANFGYPAASQDWWDNMVMSPAPAVTAGQNSAGFGLTSGGDCYNIVCEGLYYRTACLVCNVIPLAATTATTSSCTVGSASVFPTGGQGPYSYTWTPAVSTTSAANNIATGNYVVKIADATGCNTIQVNITIPAGSATVNVTSATVCPGAAATLNASNALTYTWNPGNLVGPSQTFTPPSTQVYTVIGSAAGGCTAQATGTITVNPAPVPLPNSNSPVCTGGNINLSVNAFTSYTWTGPSSFNSNLQNPTITNASTINAGSYTVKVTSAQGCTAQAVVNVIVNPTPTITVGNTGPYCAGNAIQLNVTAANTYTWTGPLAFNSNAQNPTIANSTTNMAGPYVVTVTAVGGCISTGTTNVVVNALPTPTATSNSPVCLNKQINLFANPAAVSYTWAGPNSFASNAQNPSIASAALVNGGNYTLSVTNAAGCTNTAVVTVVINPLPTVTVNNPITCVGSAFNLTAGTGTAYAWTGPNAFSSTLQNPPFANAQTTLNGNYTVVVTSAQGCTNSAVAIVSVITNPTVSVIGTNTLCSQNLNGSPNITTLTAGGASTYQWIIAPGFAGNPSSTSNPITVTAPLTTTSLVATMTVIGTAGSCTNQAVYTLTVYPNPTVATTSGSMCAGTSVTLTASNASTYTWSPATALNTTNGPIVVANPAVTTVYSVIGSSVGCNSQTQNATASVVPNPTVTINPNPALICLGSSINLTASGANNYTWTPATALTSTNTANTSANPTVTTTYTVIGSSNTCTHLATVQVSVIGLPTVVVAGTNTLCSQNFNGSPATTTLTASGAGTYVWTLPAGFSGSPSLNSNPLVITPPVTTTSMVATMTVLGTAGTCTNQAVYTLTVLPNPTVATTSGSMCAGTSVTLTASNASTYTWSPATALNTTNGPIVIANPANTTVYSVIGSSLGCNAQTQNATALVVPNPTVTINPNPAVICLNQSINLTASGANNYTWSPNVALTTTLGPNTTANPSVTTVYQIIGEAATCTHVTNITVSVLPLPTVNVVPSSPTLCMNNFNGSPNTVSLTANGATTYTWLSIVGLTTNTLNGSMIIGTSNGNPVATGSVIGANGTCTNVGTFTVNAIPNPVIATTSGSMCAGTSVSLTAANAQTYTWSPSATLNTANGPVVIASPTITTVYSVIGSSAGCQGVTQNAIATVVNNPTVSIAPLTPTICFGSAINLTGSGANNYTWSPNTAISSTVGNVVTVNPTVTTTYQLIGEASTCTHTAFQTVTVVPLPVINIALSSPTMCMDNFNGSVNQITVTAFGATSYNWIGFTGITPNTNSGSPIVVTAIPNTAIGTGTVIGSAQTCTSSATFTVLANPNPIISVPSVSVCQFKSVDVVASGATTYTWSPANTLNSSTGATVTASNTVTTVYSIIGSSINCNSPTEQATVTVVANPQIIISPVNPTICAGDPIGLSAFGANNYTWSPNQDISTIFGANVIVNPTTTTVYQVMGEAATCTSVAMRQVSVIPLPDLQAVVSPSAICVGEKTTINANGATSYTWTPSIGLSSNASNFVIANPTVSTVYSLFGSNGVCSTSISVVVNVTPRPLLLLSTDNPKICKGSSANIFASGALSYSWTPAINGNITNTTMATVSPSVSTRYTVTGYNAGCPFTKEIEIEVVQTITATVSNSVEICQGESARLTAGGSNTYLWIPGAGISNSRIAMPYADPKETTEYTVFVSDGGNCPVTATVLVKVNPLPIVNAGPDKIYNVDEPMYLSAVGTGTLTWTFGEEILCHVCPNTQIMPKQSGNYKIQAVNEFGCRATDDVNIEVTNDYTIYIPNIFTPNYDGINETFLVYGVGISDIQVTIFDRWGEQLYHDENQTKGWDGTYKDELCKNDVYVYLVKFTSLDGKKHTKSGHVTLMK